MPGYLVSSGNPTSLSRKVYGDACVLREKIGAWRRRVSITRGACIPFGSLHVVVAGNAVDVSDQHVHLLKELMAPIWCLHICEAVECPLTIGTRTMARHMTARGRNMR